MYPVAQFAAAPVQPDALSCNRCTRGWRQLVLQIHASPPHKTQQYSLVLYFSLLRARSLRIIQHSPPQLHTCRGG